MTLRPDRLRSPEVFALKAPRVTTVHTERLRVLALHRAAFDETNRLVLDIECNDEVGEAASGDRE